ncbi:MAG: bifunctional phosphopantothenoylcysteine decarboxylase/phosphopantothenate--cysteine ligase CoaBC [Oscillospiraceae bacterium]|nr:bifunctional phosphopantothenoylcysteine decarboxylase/phosphopantothenate--cysteine ligase CoaBC [Oscillospiraceae bacterium]
MDYDFSNKTVVLGVSGGIAAYKSVALASLLKKQGADVRVIMTKNAVEFVTPLTFSSITGNRCITSAFDTDFEWEIGHISLAKKTDVMVIAPATANIIAKLAQGIADDMLSTAALAMTCPVIVAPAMNTAMLQNPATKKNLRTLSEYGYTVTETAKGLLACGDKGEGRMLEPERICEYIGAAVCRKDLEGKKVLITSGGTREWLDPVRYITNCSSGKMGYALARAAVCRGAQVMLISAPTTLETPLFTEIINVISARDMFGQVKKRYQNFDIIIKAAAVADFSPDYVAGNKIKKPVESNSTEDAAGQEISKTDDGFTLNLTHNPDILKWLGQHKSSEQILVGFCLETENLIENAKQKLQNKNADIIAANPAGVENSGFGGDNNTITLVTHDKVTKLESMSKFSAAHKILDAVCQELSQRLSE